MARPSFLFAPGAGAPSSSSWMRAWAERLGTLGNVTPFDYPYMRAGRKLPDRLPALVAAHREALAGARAGGGSGGPMFLAGKSMGSRVGCHVAVEEPVSGLICFGYPLVAVGNGALRDEVLVALRAPTLFVQGSRDDLCPLAKLDEVRARMTAPNQLHVVDGGDHSLSLGRAKSSAARQAESDAGVLDAVRKFVAALVVLAVTLGSAPAQAKPAAGAGAEVGRITVDDGIIAEGFALDERGERVAYVVTDGKGVTSLRVSPARGGKAAGGGGSGGGKATNLSRFSSAPERVVAVGAGWFVIANEGKRRAAAIAPGGGGIARELGPFTDAFVSSWKGAPVLVTVTDRGERSGGHDYDVAAYRAGGAQVGHKALTLSGDGTIAGTPGLVFQAFTGGYLQALVKKPGRYDARSDARGPAEIASYDLLSGAVTGAHRAPDLSRFADLIVKRSEKPGLEAFVRLEEGGGLELVGPAEKARALAFPAKLADFDVASLDQQQTGNRLFVALVRDPLTAARALHVFEVQMANARASLVAGVPLGDAQADATRWGWAAGGGRVAVMRKTRGTGGGEIVVFGLH